MNPEFTLSLPGSSTLSVASYRSASTSRAQGSRQGMKKLHLGHASSRTLPWTTTTHSSTLNLFQPETNSAWTDFKDEVPNSRKLVGLGLGSSIQLYENDSVIESEDDDDDDEEEEPETPTNAEGAKLGERKMSLLVDSFPTPPRSRSITPHSPSTASLHSCKSSPSLSSPTLTADRISRSSSETSFESNSPASLKFVYSLPKPIPPPTFPLPTLPVLQVHVPAIPNTENFIPEPIRQPPQLPLPALPNITPSNNVASTCLSQPLQLPTSTHSPFLRIRARSESPTNRNQTETDSLIAEETRRPSLPAEIILDSFADPEERQNAPNRSAPALLPSLKAPSAPLEIVVSKMLADLEIDSDSEENSDFDSDLDKQLDKLAVRAQLLSEELDLPSQDDWSGTEEEAEFGAWGQLARFKANSISSSPSEKRSSQALPVSYKLVRKPSVAEFTPRSAVEQEENFNDSSEDEEAFDRSLDYQVQPISRISFHTAIYTARARARSSFAPDLSPISSNWKRKDSVDTIISSVGSNCSELFSVQRRESNTSVEEDDDVEELKSVPTSLGEPINLKTSGKSNQPNLAVGGNHTRLQTSKLPLFLSTPPPARRTTAAALPRQQSQPSLKTRPSLNSALPARSGTFHATSSIPTPNTHRRKGSATLSYVSTPSPNTLMLPAVRQATALRNPVANSALPTSAVRARGSIPIATAHNTQSRVKTPPSRLPRARVD